VSANWRRETEEREVERKRAEGSKLKAEGIKAIKSWKSPIQSINFNRHFAVSGVGPATGKTAGLIEREVLKFTAEFAENAEEKFLNNLCDLRVLR